MLTAVPNEILDLCEIFDRKKTTLYLVGGYVRAAIMQLGREDDIDMASAMPPEDVIKLLSKTDYKVYYRNRITGVLVIEKNGYQFEHATFRTETYAVKGEHMPAEIQFIDDVNKDALRRDFTCNSIYYDPLTGEVVDPTGGFDDIKQNVLRAVGSPRSLFSLDSERILRMVRIASCCGFDIEPATLKVAQQNVFRLKFLTAPRIRNELNKMLLADLKYPGLGLRSAHVRAIRLLCELGAFEYLMPTLNEALSSDATMPNGLTILNYTLFLLSQSTPDVRLAALLSLNGAQTYQKRGVVQKGFGAECAYNAETELAALGYSKQDVETNKNLVLLHEKFANQKLSLKDARVLMTQNGAIADQMLSFSLACASTAKIRKLSTSVAFANLALAQKQAKHKLYPTLANQVKITTEDINSIDPNLSAKEVANIKNQLLIANAKAGQTFSTQKNIKFATKLIKKLNTQKAD